MSKLMSINFSTFAIGNVICAKCSDVEEFKVDITHNFQSSYIAAFVGEEAIKFTEFNSCDNCDKLFCSKCSLTEIKDEQCIECNKE